MEATIVVGVILAVVVALIAPTIATRKGYSFAGFLILSLVAWPIALVAALVLTPRSTGVGVGDIVKVRDSVVLKGGGRIPARHTSKVLGLDVIDGHAVVQVTAPDGSPRWIAKSNVVPA